MTTIAFDTETFLIEQAWVAPQLVCISTCLDGDDGDVIHVSDPAARRFVIEMLESEHQIVGQNVPFDFAVLCAQWPDLISLVFKAYDGDRIVDTMVRQKLIDIARGMYRGYRNGMTGIWIEHKYHLADLARRHEYPFDLDKDTWRLRYNELYETPVANWPQGAIDYSRHDALSTWWVWARQEEFAGVLLDQYRQSRAHWALHLMSCWGLRTHGEMVEKLEYLTREMLNDHEATLLQHQLLERKAGGGFTKKMKRAQEYAERLWKEKGYDEIPALALTKGGKASLNEDAVDHLDDPVATAFQQYSSAATVLGRVSELRAGIEKPIHTRFDELMQSGRTSSSNPNIQNRTTSIMRRSRCEHPTNSKKIACPTCGQKYILAGDRESFIPREGNVFLVSDVPGLELRTIAQTAIKIIGYSRLAEILNAGKDPHTEVAATILRISTDVAYQRQGVIENDYEFYLARQTGKVVNFGLNARLGWRNLINNARKLYGVTLTEQQAKDAIEAYYIVYPEQREFHDWVDANCRSNGGTMTVTHLFSERVQGLIPPTVASNTYSQGLGGDATKAALYALAKACYVSPGALLGSRNANYVHDEYHIETRNCDLDRKGEEMADIICSSANVFLPDVPIPRSKMKPIACERWSKMAHIVNNPDGTLGVWKWKDWYQQ